jgi:DNA adenine methylase
LSIDENKIKVLIKSMTSITKPFLKWVGGKTQILDDVLQLFPAEMENYYEPFLGGGSVLLGLLSKMKDNKIKVKSKIYASDLNPNLIAMYKNIQSNPDALINEVKLLTQEFASCTGTVVNRSSKTKEEAMTSQESYYFWIRLNFNAMTQEERQSPKGSAMMLFMNKTGFRGLYREGPKGFNVPFGNYKKPTVLDETHIRQVSTLIQGVTFSCQSYSNILKMPKVGDFVYLDPPYAPENETSFVGYTAEGFTLDNHKDLFKTCNIMCENSINLVMSNAAVPLVTSSFSLPKFTTKVISCKRSINSKNPEAKTNEVLIKNERGI